MQKLQRVLLWTIIGVFMLLLTVETLKKVSKRGKLSIYKGIVEYQHLFNKYEVNTLRRVRYFLAQLAHESDGFRTTREYASGRAYEGRRDLGNVRKGDGVRYRGRGLIQLTGRYNYKKYGKMMGVDLEANPEMAEEFPLALEIALAYWKTKGLNELADKGKFRRITKLINGGYRGYADRLRWLYRLRKLYK